MQVGAETVVVFRVGSLLCAIPVRDVEETMRPLPVEPAAAAAPFVLGVSRVRGEPVPVVDARRMLDEAAAGADPRRLLTLKVGGRRVALAVDEVVGVRTLPPEVQRALPPLIGGERSAVASGIGVLDGEFAWVLRGASVVPEAVWDAVEAKEVPA